MSTAIDTLPLTPAAPTSPAAPAHRAHVDAAHRFRSSGDPAHLAEVVLTVIERHIESDLHARLRAESGEDLRLAEDLGVDSLTRMEIGLLAEDVLRITISYDELCAMRTVGDVRRFVEDRLAPR